jgi:AcrR family transcriptional regulator
VRQRNPAKTRAAILKAALDEFGSQGFAGARTERIAAQAGCNIRMLYHHFGDKAALYRAVLEAAYADLRRQEAAVDLDPADPLRALEMLLRFTLRYFAEHPELEGLIRSENMIQGRFLRQSSGVTEAGAALMTRIGAVLAEGRAQGVIRPGLDPATLYVTITALSRFHLANAYSMSAITGADLPSAGWRTAWEAHCVALLRAYLAYDRLQD